MRQAHAEDASRYAQYREARDRRLAEYRSALAPLDAQYVADRDRLSEEYRTSCADRATRERAFEAAHDPIYSSYRAACSQLWAQYCAAEAALYAQFQAYLAAPRDG